MNPRPILIALGCVIALVVGAYLFGRLYFNPSREDTPPIVTTDKPGPTVKGHWHGDVWHNETTTDSEPKPEPTAKGHQDGDVWHDKTVIVKQPVPDIAVPNPVQFTIPLTDAERQILESPIPTPDENGTPRPFMELTRQQKDRVMFEMNKIGLEAEKISKESLESIARRESGTLTLEESGKISADIRKRITLLEERYNLLPKPLGGLQMKPLGDLQIPIPEIK